MFANPYITPGLVALLMAALSVCTAWPWLRRKESRDKAVLLCVVGVSLALALYLHLGSPFILGDIQRQQEENRAVLSRIAELEAERRDGDMDAGEWAELGAGYMAAERYAQAVEALRQAVTASAGEPNLIMAYGKAQMLAADGTITEGAKKAFAMAGELMPENPEPFFLLAVERMQAGDTEGAKQRFAELLPKLPPQAPLRAIIEMRMREME